MKLGIKGNETRGDEIIKILEILGGKNRHEMSGSIYDKYFYYIDDEYKDISYSYIGPDEINGYEIFSLEDFLEKFPYKVGDKVEVWKYYLEGHAEIEVDEIRSMRWNSASCEIAYRLKDMTGEFYKDDIKGKVNDDEEHKTDTSIDYGDKCNNGKIIEKSEMNMNDNNVDLTLKGEIYHGNRISYVIPDGYEFSKIENNEIIIQKKKPIYPKTYEECCEMLNTINSGNTCIVLSYLGRPIFSLAKLIIIRDAYWKIAGDWEEKRKEKAMHYVICSTLLGEVVKDSMPNCIANYLLDFPTEEMRDAFFDNFKDLIEQCKELL